MQGKRKEESTFPVSSSRAKPRDLFRWRQEGECLAARNGKHRIAERRWAVLPIKGLAKEEAKGVTKKISRCARNDSVGNGYPVHPAKAVPGKHSSRIVIGSEACPQCHLSIYFHSTPCISNNYLFFQFGILEIHASKKTWRE